MLKFTFAALFSAAAMFAPAAASAQGNADAGKNKISMCVGCHEIGGYKASFPVVYSVPYIAGQSSKYIEASLQAYKKGDRSHPTMRAIAGSLSDQDIADLAAYYGTK
ncbi:MAG TPA: cytochrome c [Burkholderiaceae bacterium]|nr:cytochrome c [Burkholderiaceae bacterium]